MDSSKKLFGQRLKELRKSKHYTQEQLAELVGMDTQNLCKMENGNHFPQFRNLYKIANILGVEIKDLFEYEHLDSKDHLVEKITKYIENAKEKDLKFIYKIIQNLMERDK